MKGFVRWSCAMLSRRWSIDQVAARSATAFMPSSVWQTEHWARNTFAPNTSCSLG